MHEIPSWEANTCTRSEGISCFLWNSMFIAVYIAACCRFDHDNIRLMNSANYGAHHYTTFPTLLSLHLSLVLFRALFSNTSVYVIPLSSSLLGHTIFSFVSFIRKQLQRTEYSSYLFQLDCRYRWQKKFLSKKTFWVSSKISCLLKMAHFL